MTIKIQAFISIFIITLSCFCYDLSITEKKGWLPEIHLSALKNEQLQQQ